MRPAEEAAALQHDAQAEQALRDVGVSEEDIQAARQAERASPPPELGPDLWAWHQDAVRLLEAMRTQWRVVAGLGGVMYLGLDYGPMRGVMKTIGLKHRLNDPQLFEQLQVMERAARDELNELHSRG